MACFYPGRILIGPKQGFDGMSYLTKVIEKDLGGDFEYEHGVGDIIGPTN